MPKHVFQTYRELKIFVNTVIVTKLWQCYILRNNNNNNNNNNFLETVLLLLLLLLLLLYKNTCVILCEFLNKVYIILLLLFHSCIALFTCTDQ